MGPKRVGTFVPVKAGKHPQVSQSTHVPDGRVSWRLSDADLGGNWPWSACTGDDLRLVLDLLGAIDHKDQTWASMSGKGVGKIRAIDVRDLISEAQRRLATIKKDDHDHLHEIMVTNVKRLWGRRIGNTFHVLWWDPGHEVCPATKKHT